MTAFRSGALSATDIFQWLVDLRAAPHTPESGFNVSAIFRARLSTRDDYYFAGLNVENSDHRLSSHGEEGAISAAVAALGPEVELTEGWVMGAPAHVTPASQSTFTGLRVTCCGKCTQQMVGLALPDAPIHSVALDGTQDTRLMRDMLAAPFSFRQMMSVMPGSNTSLNTIAVPDDITVLQRLTRTGKLEKADIFNWLQELPSIDHASKVSHSAVLRLDNGTYVAGTKVEEAAYIDISPVQAAVAIARAHYGPCKIEEVWSLATGRDGKQLQPDQYMPLPLSNLQVIAENTDNPTLLMHYFTSSGAAQSATLTEATRMMPTTARPYRTYRP